MGHFLSNKSARYELKLQFDWRSIEGLGAQTEACRVCGRLQLLSSNCVLLGGVEAKRCGFG